MKLFLYENVGPKAVNESDTLSMQSHAEQILLRRRKADGASSDHEFLDILQSTLNDLEVEDIVRANQMALRRDIR
jgi:hypothetical protein